MSVMYKVRQGESIRDVAINACGSISAWEDLLNLNGFTEWTPTLTVSMMLNVPDIIDVDVQKNKQLYPANNAPDIPDLSTKILTFTGLLDASTLYDFTPANFTRSFVNYYTVRENETIRDVCLNYTGTIDNWELILNANEFTEWVPSLLAGQKVIIPTDVEIQNNVLMVTSKYPSNNGPDISNFDALVSDFISNFTNNWILATSYWNDAGEWMDSEVWID